MPPRFQFSKKQMIDSALSIVRRDGFDTLSARTLAKELGSSSKVIFGQFEDMDELKKKTINAAFQYNQDFIKAEQEKNKYPPYKAYGMAYIKFAKVEPNLFRLLFMRSQKYDIKGGQESFDSAADMIASNLNIRHEDAEKLHLEMWIFVHGIATMICTSYMDWSDEFISGMLTDMYSGIKNNYKEK